MSDELAAQIETNAGKPKRARVDDVDVEQHSLPDQIVADRYLSSRAAASTGLGIRRVLSISPGAVADGDV